jgi:hypothetical protein
MGDETRNKPPIINRIPAMPPPAGDVPPVTTTTRVTPNGSTTVVVQAPRPCGLVGCVAEVLFGVGSNLPTRVHLNARQRAELILGLGGTLPAGGDR